MIRKILLVDDDLILRMALEKRLAVHRDSFAVVTAADGFEAVKELKRFPFSLIIVDLIMPRMDGMSLIAHIRENYPDLPVIVISAMESPEIKAKITAGGVLAYLGKPFGADDLLPIIMSSLRNEADGGIMYAVSPTVFLQLMEMEAKTCTVRILDKAADQGGMFYFIDGRLVDARVGERQGIDAAYEVFTWDAVTLFIHNGCKPRENAINSDLQPIIMKAVGMKDEAEEFADNGRGEDEGSQFLVRVKSLLLKAGGADCLTGFSYDRKVGRMVDHLQQIGTAAGFGAFQAGLVRSSRKHDIIFLPGQPAPVLTVRAGSIRSQVLERIRQAAPGQPNGGQTTV